MVRQDFLLKQIEQLGRVLAQLIANMLGLKSNAAAYLQIEKVCQALREEADLDINRLLEIPEENFIQVLQENKAMDVVNMGRFAALLFHIAENIEDKERATLLYERSSVIHDYLEKSCGVYSFDRG